MKTLQEFIDEAKQIFNNKYNRDRFILPIENDITLFTNIVNNCINFFN